MLIKKRDSQIRRGVASTLGVRPSGLLDRRSFLRRSGLAAGGLAALGTLPLSGIRKAAAGPPPPPGATIGGPQERLHPLLGRLHGNCRGCERRLDRPGAGLGQPDQSRVTLREGRGGPRRCA